MTTQIYGASDDLIEFEGDVVGEVGHYDNEKGDLIICSAVQRWAKVGLCS